MQRTGPDKEKTGLSGLPTLSEHDVALGFLFGAQALRPVRRRSESDPVHALRAALRSALIKSPCVVAFSGGRDSSLLLAVAADLAAGDGLDPPVAVTFRYPGDKLADECCWQELVVEQLRRQGLKFTWECIDIGPEFDVLGRLVTPILRAHGGPLWPPAIGSTLMLADLARGGSLVTGDYGDEVLGGHRADVLRMALRRRGWVLRRNEWGKVMIAAAPEPLRRTVLGRQIEGREWLRPALRREWRERCVRHEAAQPLRWDASVHFPLRQRALIVGMRTLRAVATWYGCELVEPLGAAGFVASLAAFGGRWGIGGRTACLRLLADGLLPKAIIERRDKVYFNASRFGSATAEFVQRWDGSGLDDDLVDTGVLHDVWSAAFVPASTAMLLQRAWLNTEAGRTPGSLDVEALRTLPPGAS